MWIYEIRNVITNKIYIGQTIQKNPHIRWKHHRQLLQKNSHPNNKLQSSWNKYGHSVWKFTILDAAHTLEELNARETQYIIELNCISDGYNILPGGTNTYRKIKRGRVQAELYRRAVPYPPIINPDGVIFDDIRNLMKFCREHKLAHRHIHELYTHTRHSHKGWKCHVSV